MYTFIVSYFKTLASNNQHRLLKLIIFMVITAVSTAQTENLIPDDTPQYQVELIVFERSKYTESTPTETWVTDISLAYPKEKVFFQDDEPASPIIDEVMTSDINDTAIQTIEPDLINNTIENNTEEVELTDINIEPFNGLVKLPPHDRHLTPQAKRLKRVGGYHILFHETWMQTLEKYKDSIPITILGGEEIIEHENEDTHFELEGTIKVSLDRYLHMETNLWRTFFVDNIGQDITDWPTLPERFPKPEKQYTFSDGLSQTIKNQYGSILEHHDPIQINTPKKSQTEELTTPIFTDKKTSKNTFSGSNIDYDSSIIAEKITHKYALKKIQNIVTLKQERRMRSDELHYIDHPHLGVLIKIKKVSLNDNKIMP